VCVCGGGGRIRAYRVLVGKPVGNGPVTMPRLRWEGDCKCNLNTRMGRCKWIDLVEDWVGQAAGCCANVKNLRVPYSAGIFLKS
jgi:hypothetical protein